MDTEELRRYVAQILYALGRDGSYEEGNVSIWFGEDGYWVRAGNGIPHGYGPHRALALSFFLHCLEEAQ